MNVTTISDNNDFDPIEPLLPTDGFLGAYLHFTRNLEACPRFRFFSAACVFGAAINNRCWLQRGDEGLLPRLMPNPWVILLGPPFRGHKTSCINLAVNCLVKAFPNVRILADKLTPEAIVHALAEPTTAKESIQIGTREATGLIQAPEMSVIFGKQQYNTGMVSLITDLYDFREEWKSETIGRGKEILKNNCISIIAGSTPNWMASMIPQDAFTGGFMRRFIIVELPALFYKKDPRPKKPDNSDLQAVVDAFKLTKDLRGIISWSPDGSIFYDNYYKSFTPTGDEQYDSYKEAESEQALKIAMLLDLNKGSQILSANSLDLAVKILRSISPETISRIQSLTTNPRMNIVQELKTIITKEGLISESELMKRIYRRLSQGEKQFYEALSVLKKTEDIESVGKAPKLCYKMTKKLGEKSKEEE